MYLFAMVAVKDEQEVEPYCHKVLLNFWTLQICKTVLSHPVNIIGQRFAERKKISLNYINIDLKKKTTFRQVSN